MDPYLTSPLETCQSWQLNYSMSISWCSENLYVTANLRWISKFAIVLIMSELNWRNGSLKTEPAEIACAERTT